MAFIVRDARVADIPAIFAIRTSVRENHLSMEALERMGITPDAIREVLQAAPCLWVAEIDGEPAGFSMADADDGCVFAAFVRPEWEGQGIGRCLMQKAEEFLFERHDRIWLETDGKSRAAGFYRSLGWHVIETLPSGDVRFEKRQVPPGGKRADGRDADRAREY
jgi:GNAT superfamily N-acetyltransferase